MDALPEEVLALILRWLDARALGRVACVSRRLRAAADQSDAWREMWMRQPVVRIRPADEPDGWRGACRRRAALVRTSRGAIAFVSDTPTSGQHGREQQVVVLNTATRARHVLSEPSPLDEFLLQEVSFSSCGLRVAYSMSKRLGTYIMTHFVDGSDAIQVRVPRMPFYYSWSPDSRFLTWLSSSAVGPMTFRFIDLLDGETWECGGIEIHSEHPCFYAWLQDSRRMVVHSQSSYLSIVTLTPDPDATAARPRALTPEQLQHKTQVMVHRQRVPLTMGFFSTPIVVRDTAQDTVVVLPIMDGNTHDQTVVLLSLQRMAVLHRIIRMPGGVFVRMTFSPDATKLCMVTDLGSVHVMHLYDAEGRLKPEISIAALPALGEFNSVQAVFWSPDSSMLVMAGTGLSVWNVDTRERIMSVEWSSSGRSFHQYLNFYEQYQASSTLWSPDSRHFVFCSKRQVCLFTPATGESEVLSTGDGATYSPNAGLRV